MSSDRRKRGGIAVILAWLALVLAVLSIGLLFAAPYYVRSGQLDLMTALRWLVLSSMVAGSAALLVALLRAFVAWRLKTPRGRWPGRAALLIAIVSLAIPLSIIQRGASLPRIHDVTTDTVDPPNFVDLATQRGENANSDVYGGPKVAQQQAIAYSDIAPIILNLPPDAAFQKALAAAKALKWKIVSTVPESGRLEATDTSFWFRFKDDIVIRVRAEGEGSRIDIRSLSRMGESDLGGNAAHIREFRAHLG